MGLSGEYLAEHTPDYDPVNERQAFEDALKMLEESKGVYENEWQPSQSETSSSKQTDQQSPVS